MSEAFFVSKDVTVATGRGDDLRLFVTTWLAGFVFFLVFLA
jgi:hypothetical protein